MTREEMNSLVASSHFHQPQWAAMSGLIGRQLEVRSPILLFGLHDYQACSALKQV